MNEEKEKITENYTKIKAAIEKEKGNQKQHEQKFEVINSLTYSLTYLLTYLLAHRKQKN
jgi:hypothetical protein